MKGLLALALFALVSAEDLVPLEVNYHENIGIPLATKLRRAEEAKDFDGSRIVGGSIAGLGTHPHLAAVIITIDRWTSVCGGSLLTHTRSVTAAHCWRTGTHRATMFTFAYGTTNIWSGGVRVQTRDVHMHPNYDWNRLHNDIAIVNHGWVGYTNVIQPIFLPPNHLLNNQFVGWWAWAAGFGITVDGSNSNQLKHQVAQQVISHAVCQRTWPYLTASNLCVDTSGGRSPCSGDSGGPLAFTYGGRRTLIGVTSFGAGRCAAGYPAVFVRVTSVVPWIRSRI